MLGLNKPPIDVETRWNSTYIMLEKLLALKDTFTIQMQNSLSTNEWQDIVEIVKVLKPLYEATLKLQKEQLLLGDFFKLWILMKAELKSIEGPLSEEVYEYVVQREGTLIDTEIVNAALFLDPRLRRTLTREKKEEAKIYLKKLASQMLSVIEASLHQIKFDCFFKLIRIFMTFLETYCTRYSSK